MKAFENCPSDLAEILQLIIKKCNGMQGFVEQFNRPPLLCLAGSQLQKLFSEVDDLVETILDTYDPQACDDGGEDPDTPFSEPYIKLREVTATLFETIGLLDYCKRAEQDGDEGELNAKYATLFLIPDKKPSMPSMLSSSSLCSLRSRGNENINYDEHHDGEEPQHIDFKTRRLQQMVISTLSPLFTKFSTLGRRTWGSPNAKDPGMGIEELDESLIEVAEHIHDSYILEALHDHFMPRYIHTYPSECDTPFDIDRTHFKQGSYGRVYKATCKARGDLFAMKEYEIVKPEQREGVLKELAVLELCSHRNIIQLVDAFDVAGMKDIIRLVMYPYAPYTLEEFLTSSNYHRRLSCPWFCPSNAKSDQVIYRILRELTDGLGYLHDMSIKHKDIKPANILFRREGSEHVIPVIADVGLSKVYTADGITNYTKSTYQWLALEQLNKEESSLKSDVWQLGCCFAFILGVAIDGKAGCDALWSSVKDSKELSSYVIAWEAVHFMEKFNEICLPGTADQETAHGIITRMLDLSPSTRIDIQTAGKEFTVIAPVVSRGGGQFDDLK